MLPAFSNKQHACRHFDRGMTDGKGDELVLTGSLSRAGCQFAFFDSSIFTDSSHAWCCRYNKHI